MYILSYFVVVFSSARLICFGPWGCSSGQETCWTIWMWSNKIGSSFINLFHSYINYLMVTKKKKGEISMNVTACFLYPLLVLTNTGLTSSILQTILLFEIHTLKYCHCLSDNYSSLLPATTLLYVWAVGWVGYVYMTHKLTGSDKW
jgi:hypothetical protein